MVRLAEIHSSQTSSRQRLYFQFQHRVIGLAQCFGVEDPRTRIKDPAVSILHTHIMTTMTMRDQFFRHNESSSARMSVRKEDICRIPAESKPAWIYTH